MNFETLIQQPEASRDEAWELKFFSHIPELKVIVEKEEPQPGPDGRPYLFLKTSGEAQEPFTKVLNWLAQKGVGAVINAHKMIPDYIFTYGMVWNYVHTGRFVNLDAKGQNPGEVVFENKESMLMGAPTESYLPQYVKAILRSYFQFRGIHAPRILVVSSQDYQKVDLLIGLESLNSLEAKGQRRLAEDLNWFLPLHYSVVLISEQGWPPFHAL